MPERYETLDQKPYRSRYLFFEALFDYPVEKVWPHALDIGSWMTLHRFETIAGEPGKVGHFERVFAAGVADDAPQPHYHLYGIAEIIPEKFIALEYFPERGGSYGDASARFGFDGLLFSDFDKKTRLTFLIIEYELEPGRGTKAKLGDDETVREIIERFFENLRRLVANAEGA